MRMSKFDLVFNTYYTKFLEVRDQNIFGSVMTSNR